MSDIFDKLWEMVRVPVLPHFVNLIPLVDRLHIRMKYLCPNTHSCQRHSSQVLEMVGLYHSLEDKVHLEIRYIPTYMQLFGTIFTLIQACGTGEVPFCHSERRDSQRD